MHIHIDPDIQLSAHVWTYANVMAWPDGQRYQYTGRGTYKQDARLRHSNKPE